MVMFLSTRRSTESQFLISSVKGAAATGRWEAMSISNSGRHKKGCNPPCTPPYPTALAQSANRDDAREGWRRGIELKGLK